MSKLDDMIQREIDDADYHEEYLRELEEDELEASEKAREDAEIAELDRIDEINAINRKYGATEIPGGRKQIPDDQEMTPEVKFKYWMVCFVFGLFLCLTAIFIAGLFIKNALAMEIIKSIIILTWLYLLFFRKSKSS